LLMSPSSRIDFQPRLFESSVTCTLAAWSLPAMSRSVAARGVLAALYPAAHVQAAAGTSAGDASGLLVLLRALGEDAAMIPEQKLGVWLTHDAACEFLYAQQPESRWAVLGEFVRDEPGRGCVSEPPVPVRQDRPGQPAEPSDTDSGEQQARDGEGTAAGQPPHGYRAGHREEDREDKAQRTEQPEPPADRPAQRSAKECAQW
jgi:hypothetical protein